MFAILASRITIDMASTTKPTINTYVSDMLALERHIAQPIGHQAKDEAVAKSPRAARVVNEALSISQAHIDALERRLEALGGHSASAVKSGVASAVGVAAAAIGNARKTEVSKYLRDDYSALALASAGYTMLHTTALAMGDPTTAELAQRHLADVATTVMRISATLPAIVLDELREEGVPVTGDVASAADRAVDEAWKQGAARSSN
jgi:ferritin-like metal-binding protein YciE